MWILGLIIITMISYKFATMLFDIGMEWYHGWKKRSNRSRS